MSEIDRTGLTGGEFDSDEPQTRDVADVSGVTGEHDELPVVPPSIEVAAEASVGDPRLTDVAYDLKVPDSLATLNPNWFRRHKTFLKIGTAALAVVTAGAAYLTTRGGSSHENDTATAPKSPVATAAATPSSSPSASAKPTFGFSGKVEKAVAGETSYPGQGYVNITRVLSKDKVQEVPLPNGTTFQLPELRSPDETSPTEFANSFLALLAYYETVPKDADPAYLAAQDKLLAGVISGGNAEQADTRSFFEQTRQAALTIATGLKDSSKVVTASFEDSTENPAKFIMTTDDEGNPAVALDVENGGPLKVRYWADSDITGRQLGRGQESINDLFVDRLVISYTHGDDGYIGISGFRVHYTPS